MYTTRSPLLILVLGCFALFTIQPVLSQTKSRKEIDIGFASLDAVKPILKKALSPTGRYVVLQAKGTVMVIDDAKHIAAAEQALAGGALPNPDVNLNFAFRTGMPPRRTQISVGREVYFPTGYSAPQIPNRVSGNGPFPITPAHPTGFVKRHIGFTSDTTSQINPDGSITLDINQENTSFDGFINYGSPITLPTGAIGNVPVGQAGNPGFFQQVIPNNILLPVISTTRISTSVVIRPRVVQGNVNLDLMPRLTIHLEDQEEGVEPVEVNLRQFRTNMTISNNGVGRVYGFTNASEDFNRNFLGAKDVTKGGTAIMVKALVTPGKVKPAAVNSEGETVSPTSDQQAAVK